MVYKADMNDLYFPSIKITKVDEHICHQICSLPPPTPVAV